MSIPHSASPSRLLRSALALAALLLPLLRVAPVRAQNADLQQDLQVRVGASARKELGKDFKIWLSPQMRTDGINPDRYLLELTGGYEPIKYLDLRAEIRGDLEERGTELDHGFRPGASITGSYPLDDFKPSLRFYYTHDFGRLRDTRDRFRYRAKLDYNVPKIPLGVSVAAEAFQQLDERGFYKMRYGISFDYKIINTKKIDHFVYAGYMLDYYLDEPRNLHIPEIGYKVYFE